MRAICWEDRYMFKVYDLARRGESGFYLAKKIGITFAIFQDWMKKRKYFRLAVEEGEKQYRRNPFCIIDYFGKLSVKEKAEMKKWDEFNGFDPKMLGLDVKDRRIIMNAIVNRDKLKERKYG